MKIYFLSLQKEKPLTIACIFFIHFSDLYSSVSFFARPLIFPLSPYNEVTEQTLEGHLKDTYCLNNMKSCTKRSLLIYKVHMLQIENNIFRASVVFGYIAFENHQQRLLYSFAHKTRKKELL